MRWQQGFLGGKLRTTRATTPTAIQSLILPYFCPSRRSPHFHFHVGSFSCPDFTILLHSLPISCSCLPLPPSHAVLLPRSMPSPPSSPFFLVAASRLLSTSPSYLSTMLYTVLSPPHPLYSPLALIFSLSSLSSSSPRLPPFPPCHFWYLRPTDHPRTRRYPTPARAAAAACPPQHLTDGKGGKIWPRGWRGYRRRVRMVRRFGPRYRCSSRRRRGRG